MDEKPEATEPQSHHSRGSRLTWFLWMFFLVFVVYPLSIGPAAWLHLKAPPVRPAIEGFYKPVTMLADHFEQLGDFMHWYVVSVWQIPGGK
jgi:hypothetical protein